ncbi:TonB-dependent receptor [Methylocystis sp. JAN1]|uniref:TonB-dependent receptor plug domain-containing protein n=1 Tax=Methylocystis sp. JAN1 TaxID=3397211 RepID=UPI003FA1FA4F
MRRFLTIVATIGALALLGAPALARNKTRHPGIPPGAQGNNGYFEEFASGPGGSKVPVQNYPGSTTVITRKMMDDFQTRSVCQAALLAPGVTGSCR